MVQRVARWKALEKLLLAKHHSSSCTDQLEIILSALVFLTQVVPLSIFSSSNRTKLWANTYNTKSKLFLYLNVEEIFVHFFCHKIISVSDYGGYTQTHRGIWLACWSPVWDSHRDLHHSFHPFSKREIERGEDNTIHWSVCLSIEYLHHCIHIPSSPNYFSLFSAASEICQLIMAVYLICTYL